MFRNVLMVAVVLCLVSSAVHAQSTAPVLPTKLEVIILPATGDPATVAPIASRSTDIATLNAINGVVVPNIQCGRTASPVSTGTLVNPTKVEVDDPFAPGKICTAPIPANLPDGNYRAVAVFSAPSCQAAAGGPLITPCPSARSMVGAPPFSIASLKTSPVVPTGLVVLP